MGKAARAKKDRSDDLREEKRHEREVASYFARTGLNQPSNGEQLWKGIEAKLGARFKNELIEAISERERTISSGEAPDNSVYQLLYRDLDTALVTTPLMTPMARVWLTRFCGLDLPGGNLLDIGSGSGFLTCFYAIARPEAEVVGVELTAEGVACGDALAERLGLTNVRFEVGDIAKYETDTQVQVITSVANLRDLEPQVPDPPQPFSWLLSGNQFLDEAESSLLVAVSRLLAEDGTFVSMERLGTFGDVAWWLGAHSTAGLSVDLEQSHHVRFDMPPYGSQSMPAIVSHRSVGAVSALEIGDVARWYDRQDLKGTEVRLELMISVAPGITPVAGHHFEVRDPRGEGQTRLFTLKGDERSIIYMTTSRGARELVAEGPDAESLADIYKDLVDRFADLPDVVDHSELDLVAMDLGLPPRL